MLSADSSGPSLATGGHPSLVRDDDHTTLTMQHCDKGVANANLSRKSIGCDDNIHKEPTDSYEVNHPTTSQQNSFATPITTSSTTNQNPLPPHSSARPTNHIHTASTHTPSNPYDTRKQIHPNNAPAFEASTAANSPSLNHADSAVKDSSSPPHSPTGNNSGEATRIVSPTTRVASSKHGFETSSDPKKADLSDSAENEQVMASHNETPPESGNAMISENSETPTDPVPVGSQKRKVPEAANEFRSIDLDLRNKKMKPTDCLLFAATLLGDDRPPSSDKRPEAPERNNGPVFNSVKSSCLVCPTGKLTLYPLPQNERQQETQEELVQPASVHSVRMEADGSSELMKSPRDVDVLCGRGGLINKHPGNIVYRKIVDHNKPFYHSVHKKHRILVSQSIVQSILNFGGRFLIMNAKGETWTEIGYKRAVQKTSQALRERSNADEEGDSEGDEPNGVQQTATTSDGGGELEDDISE